MPRLVVPPHIIERAAERPAPRGLSEIPADGYQDRLVKYVPAESLAFYAFVDKLLISYYGIDSSGMATERPADALLGVLPWVFLLLGLVGTPVYFYKQRMAGQPWLLHAVISTIAFLFWAYTLGGSVFVLNGWYHLLIAGIAAPLFTFVAGWIKPSAT